MTTRFYLPAEGSGAPATTPSFTAGWEQTGQATRLRLLRKNQLSTLSTLANTGTRTVPITTTQDVLCNQWVSDPLRAQRINGTVSYVGRVLESATTANVTLAVVLRVMAADGTVRGTLLSTFGTDTEFATTAATRIVNAVAVTEVIAQTGDRLVLEIGGTCTAPTAATTYTMRFGTSATSDFSLTSALTTDLNPWLELSADLYDDQFENGKGFTSTGAGMNVTERTRTWG